MKLSTAFLLVSTAASASAHAIRNPSAKAKLLGKSRRLEDQQQAEEEAQQEEAEYQFLQNYSLKLIGCAAEQYTNPENGEVEYSSVVYRLCPSDECSDESATGCASGYGDFVVGINSFVDAWLEDKREDMENNGNVDDQWDLNQFSECREYEADQDADEEGGEDVVYYVGPTCSADGTIKIGFFSDYTCTTVPDGVTFEDISNGWSLPYEDGGLVTTYCESCAGYNDNGELELSEMCTQLYMGASSKCESKMEQYSQYGKDESGCEYITQSFPSTVAKKGGKAGIVIMWIILAVLIAGGLFFVYTKWWMKRKQGSAAHLSSSEGVAA
jgi:hypothetical protein